MWQRPAPESRLAYFAIQIPTASDAKRDISSFSSKQFGSKKHLEYNTE